MTYHMRSQRDNQKTVGNYDKWPDFFNKQIEKKKNERESDPQVKGNLRETTKYTE